MKNLIEFKNIDLGVSVKAIKNMDGSISINAEDVAIGLGWSFLEEKNGRIYRSIRWSAINNYCKEFGFCSKLQKDDFIPESLFYLLAMKANNDSAKKFQMWLAVDVIPEIRKGGQYISKQKSNLELLELQVKALKEVEEKVVNLDEKFNDFKDDLPLIGDEPEELSALVRSVGVRVLGGKEANAYKDKSLRSKVYSDIWGEVKRQFGVKKYKAIKRRYLDRAKGIIKNYIPTVALEEEIQILNSYS